MPTNNKTVAHSLPFSVTDLEAFISQIDESPVLAVSEEEIDGQIQVRLWAETGAWPATDALSDLISPHLTEGEVAILQRTSIEGFDNSGMEMIAINAEGDFVERNSNEWADVLREELGVRMPSFDDDDNATDSEDEDDE